MFYHITESFRFGFEVRKEVKQSETMFLLSHGNLPFWCLKP